MLLGLILLDNKKKDHAMKLKQEQQDLQYTALNDMAALVL